MVRGGDQFHTGIVVDDLDATLDSLGALFGYDWGPEVHVDTQVVFPEGERTVEFRFRYSRTTPRLEVIESRPGTLWTPAEGSGIHHLGYWSHDLEADAAALERAGYPREALGVDDTGAPRWSYHHAPGCLRIELVTTALRDLMAALWS